MFSLLDQFTITFFLKLGFIAGPVIQANGRLSFEDDLRGDWFICNLQFGVSMVLNSGRVAGAGFYDKL